jgi:Spy/CpxP family protein refolding chaperone
MNRFRPTASGRAHPRALTLLAPLAVAVLLALPALPLAAQPPGPPAGAAGAGPGQGRFPLGPLSRFLDLTGDQVTQTQALLDDLQTAVQPLHEQEKALHQQLDDLLGGDNPDAAAVGALVIQIQGVRDQIKAAHDAFDTSFTALLTATQAERWAILKEVRQAFGPRHRGPGGGPMGPMSTGS